MVPIKHRSCGSQVAWYMKDEGRDGDILFAKDYMGMDGSRPKVGDPIAVRCEKCGRFITNLYELERDFSQKQ